MEPGHGLGSDAAAIFSLVNIPLKRTEAPTSFAAARQRWCLAVLLKSLEEQFGLDFILWEVGVRFRELGLEGRGVL